MKQPVVRTSTLNWRCVVQSSWLHSDRWKTHFIRVAYEVSLMSKDPSTKVGAVIVDAVDRCIISTGFNGLPRGVADDSQILDNREVKYSWMIHAEVNAILNARRDIRGRTMYVYGLPPCERCAVQIIQAGIKHVGYTVADRATANRWLTQNELAFRMFLAAGVELGVFTLDELGGATAHPWG